MYAWHAESQQVGLTLDRVRSAIDSAYPSYFGNKEELPLKTGSELIFNPRENIATEGWLRHPLIPGSAKPFSGGKQKPGVVRSVYAPAILPNSALSII
jgi:hypothetical protein